MSAKTEFASNVLIALDGLKWARAPDAPVTSTFSSEEDQKVDQLAKEYFGSNPLRKLASAESCELSLSYSFYINYMDYLNCKRGDEFLDRMHRELSTYVRVLGPTVEDLKNLKSNPEIDLDYLNIYKLYENKLRAWVKLSAEQSSEFYGYLDAEVISRLNRCLQRTLPRFSNLSFVWESKTYRLEWEGRKSFQKVEEELLKACAESAAKASQKLKDLFDPKNSKFCNKLKSMHIQYQEIQEKKSLSATAPTIKAGEKASVGLPGSVISALSMTDQLKYKAQLFQESLKKLRLQLLAIKAPPSESPPKISPWEEVTQLETSLVEVNEKLTKLEQEELSYKEGVIIQSDVQTKLFSIEKKMTQLRFLIKKSESSDEKIVRREVIQTALSAGVEQLAGAGPHQVDFRAVLKKPWKKQ